MAEHPVTVRFGLVCEQVRREDTGKLLIIGAFGHDITVVSLPARLVLTLVIGIWSKGPVVDHAIEVQTSFNGEPIHSGRGRVTISEAGAELIVLSNIAIQLEQPGELEFKAKLGVDRWKTVTVMPVRKKA